MIDVEIGSKAPHRTCWLTVSFPEGDRPVVLLGALAAEDWGADGAPQVPPFNGREEVSLTNPGSGVFGGWSDQERRDRLGAVEAVCRAHGIRPRRRRYAFADLL